MFKNISLELSLKPFKQTDDAYIRRICAQIFEQWRPLLKNRENIAIMLWAGDGSEILDYAGDPEDTFEWAHFVGTANLPYLEKNAPLETSLHQRKQDYIKNPPVMTYGILKKIISCLKEEGKKAFPNATVRVGETFDIGPEFAISDFKYNRHTEICTGSRMDRFGFVDATVVLFPEKGCESIVSIAEFTDYTPVLDPRFKAVDDEAYGTYLKGEHISGNIYFLIGHKR